MESAKVDWPETANAMIPFFGAYMHACMIDRGRSWMSKQPAPRVVIYMVSSYHTGEYTHTN
jgi:hypothetical protein